MVSKFPPFCSKRKKRSISRGDSLKFVNRFSTKLLLTSNHNFWIFWLNGYHPLRMKRLARETQTSKMRKLYLMGCSFVLGKTLGVLAAITWWVKETNTNLERTSTIRNITHIKWREWQSWHFLLIPNINRALKLTHVIWQLGWIFSDPIWLMSLFT